MSRESSLRDLVRSRLPEEKLISQREFGALSFKYLGAAGMNWRRRACVALSTVATPSSWVSGADTTIEKYRRCKYIDGIGIEADVRSPIDAFDPEDPGARIRHDARDATFLHIIGFEGPAHLARQMQLAADYVAAHATLYTTPYIAGFTYSELGCLARKFGFGEMRITRAEVFVVTHGKASHMARCAVNGRPAPYVPTLAYLPTPAFVGKFGSGGNGSV